MTTYNDLVQRCRAALHSFSGFHEQVTWLTAEIAGADLNLQVNDSAQVRVGIIEVDDELMYVSSTTGDTVVLAPFGRGYLGTTATTHDLNAQVTNSPMFPRHDIKAALDQCVKAVYPQLFQVKKVLLEYNIGQVTYELPADADEVLTVEWERTDTSGFWEPMLEWDLVENSEEATGKAIHLLETAFQAAQVQVTYIAPFEPFSGDDTLADAGFNESVDDILVFGALSRIIRAMDITRLQTRNAENYARAGFVSAKDAMNVANGYYAYYQQRLAEERNRLLKQYPPRPHFTR